MNHFYSYKFKLEPNKEQEILLNKHFGCVRWVYNEFLARRKKEYQETKKRFNSHKDKTQLPILKKTTNPWLKEVNAQALQYAIECLDDAFLGFFGISNTGKRLKKKKGFPKKKKKHNKNSFIIKQDIEIEENKVIIPKFQEGIKFDNHRKVEGTIKFAHISKNKIGKYFISITVEREMKELEENNNSIGIDLNVFENVDSNNNKHPNLRPAEQYKKRLKLLHKKLSRSKKGSKGREKARKQLAKLYLKIHNKREDSLHKYSKCIIDENQIICVEDLNVESMLKKVKPDDRKIPRWKEKQLHRDIQDCGWASLLTKLEYKAKLYGREFIKVSQWFPSSQLCNHCGYRYHDLPKDCKEWCCLGCWEWNDRDCNSAKNILAEGLRLRTVGVTGIAICSDVRLDLG